MRELSLNILDIAQNSIAAGAGLIELDVLFQSQPPLLTLAVKDNGKGMTPEQVRAVLDPFYTTRTTRKVGMGIPLFRLAAEQAGGTLEIQSVPGEGTQVTARFRTDHIDFTPLGDLVSTLAALISMNTDRDFVCRYERDGQGFTADTREFKQILGDVPLSEPEVVQWMREYLREQIEQIDKGVM